MIRNYYTLLHLASELNQLENFYVVEAFTQEKDTVTISLSDSEREIALQFIADGRNDAFYIRKSFARAKKNTLDLFDEIIEDTLINAEVLDKNRIIKLNFINSDVYIVLFGGINSNLIVTSKSGKILNSFNKKDELIGSQITFQENKLKKISDFSPETNILNAIANCYAMLGRIYAAEFLHRNNLTENRLLSTINSYEIDDISQNLNELTNELINSNKFYVYEQKGKIIQSLIQLSDGELLRTYNSVSDSIAGRVIQDIVDSSFEPEYKKIKMIIERNIRKVQKKLEGYDFIEDAKERIAKYREYGDLLMSNPNAQIIDDVAILNDWSGNEIKISISKKLNIIENAQKYYEKAKAGESDLKARMKLKPAIQNELDNLLELQVKFDKINNLKELDKFKINYKKILGIQMQEKQVSREEKFRKFDLGDDYILYVGRNAANNDELTLKFAKPNDIWLHARGMSGSHAIIRMTGDKKPPKKILEKAGAITAYYSGAKNSSYTPVAYTLKKNVRKPKGANPGAVVISREDVIMVTPGLPEGSEDLDN